jgi:hypothetical protein
MDAQPATQMDLCTNLWMTMWTTPRTPVVRGVHGVGEVESGPRNQGSLRLQGLWTETGGFRDPDDVLLAHRRRVVNALLPVDRVRRVIGVRRLEPDRAAGHARHRSMPGAARRAGARRPTNEHIRRNQPVAVRADVGKPLPVTRTHVLHICLSAVVPIYGTGSDRWDASSRPRSLTARKPFRERGFASPGDRTRPVARARSPLNATTALKQICRTHVRIISRLPALRSSMPFAWLGSGYGDRISRFRACV